MRNWKELFALLAPLPLFCNPQGPDVLAGSAAFRVPHEQTLLIEVSDHAVIGWDSFSIAAGETTQFLQPGSQSAVLNRVSGGDPSNILGTMHANGQVYLINPNGLVFGKDAIIDTASFIASTFDLPDAEFLAGNDFHFSGDSKASLVNCGKIFAKDGSAILIGYQIDNQGSINGHNGILAAAKEVVLTHADNRLLSVHIPVSEPASLQAIAREIEENGNPLGLAIRIDDRENASQLVRQEGRLLLTGLVFQTGEIEAENIAIHSEKIFSAGPLTASSEISIHAGANYVETSSAKLSAPNISIQAEGRLFTSGSYLSVGGSVELLGNEIVLSAAQIDASGTSGGKIYIEGSTLVEATGYSSIKADALLTGEGGKVVLLSEGTTRFSGIASAQGGLENGNGGFIEISGVDLYCSGSPNVRAPHGAPGTLLLDPNNIIIDVIATTTGGGFPYFNLIDPTEGSGSNFGNSVDVLINSNLVVTKPGDSFAASGAGAVYLYNGLTGALISTLYGSFVGDGVGSNVAALVNSNFVVGSPNWNGGLGAATWCNGTGFNGQVTASNSLIGMTAGDEISVAGIVALTNGNYVVASPFWTGGTGAATWGNGTTGTIGVVSDLNSQTGSVAGDQVPELVYALAKGNYLLVSSGWNSSSGAATWGNGSNGTPYGPLSTTNSLTGAPFDHVGFLGAVALTNGNYVVLSPEWNDVMSGVLNVGAATWGDGATGTVGLVSELNSLYGTTPLDGVGTNAIALDNGHYVVFSEVWNNGIPGNAVGAATFCDGTVPTIGPVTTSNSLHGTTKDDEVGLNSGIALPNNNYVVLSENWNNGVMNAHVGAATLCNGNSGTFGPVTTSNSLYGTSQGDNVGTGATALTTGNYVVLSSNWGDGTPGNAVGAATWVDGATGLTSTGTIGPVTESNSLYGTTTSDNVGTGCIALTNGNYVVLSQNWNNGTPSTSVGAATWGDGTTGITGVVTTENSLYGIIPNSPPHASPANGDQVGSGGTSLANGDYVVLSSFWNYLTTRNNVGAITWGDGTRGITGLVTTDNSIVGTFLANIHAVRFPAVQDNPNTSPATFVYPFLTNNSTGRVVVSLDDPTLVPYQFGAPQDVTISPGFVAEILNAGSSLTLEALNDIDINSPISITPTFGTAGNLTMYANNNININADIDTFNGNLTLIANQNIISTGAVTLNTGPANMVLVVDNAHPTPPGFGTGHVDIPNATLTATGKVQIFTAIRSFNTEPGPINGLPFVPGPQFVDSSTEQWGVYYPNSFGGFPYTIFYKTGTKILFDLLNTISNTADSLIDVDWITFIWNMSSQDLELRLKRK